VIVSGRPARCKREGERLSTSLFVARIGEQADERIACTDRSARSTSPVRSWLMRAHWEGRIALTADVIRDAEQVVRWPGVG